VIQCVRVGGGVVLAIFIRESRRYTDRDAVGIMQEDGVAVGMEDFHRNLPLKKLLKNVPVTWHLTKPSLGNFFYELGGGMSDLVMDPIRGAKEDGEPYLCPQFQFH
jgi:hypothetical protein